MIGKERKTHLVKNQVISREGKIELENSHLATNIVKDNSGENYQWIQKAED